MDYPKYDGTIHPDEWVTFFLTSSSITSNCNLTAAKSLVNFAISPEKLAEINNFEELRNALKGSIFFTVFKNTNKRKLQSLKYIPEREGGDTSKFILDFCKLCYNAEIDNIEEQKKYLYKSLSNNNNYTYFLTEFYKKMKNVNSMSELVKGFEEIVMDESNLIRNGSIIALKHVATGKYLNSIKDLHYTTGSKIQLVFAGSSDIDPNALWKINFNNYDTNKELASYAKTDNISLQHLKSDNFLGILGINYYEHYKSPSTEHTEVNCYYTNYSHCFRYNWNFKHCKLESNQEYLISNDIINLSIKNCKGQEEFLSSHDVQFTIGDDTFQEVFCHNERLGGNDEWCIELFH